MDGGPAHQCPEHGFHGGTLPTYSYACTACDHRFDIHQEFTDSALTVCPECEGRLRKLFGSVGVTFKGSGFYRTDHGGGSVKAGASGSAGAGAGSSGSGSAGSGSSGAGSSSSKASESKAS